MNLKEAMKNLLETASEHSGTICAVAAVGGVFVTAWLSGKAAVKVNQEIDPDMTRKEKAKLYCKAYWKTGISAAATTGLIIGSDRIHVGKEAVLATGAAIWKEKATDLEKKVREELGDEKTDELKKKIVEEKIKEAEEKGELNKSQEQRESNLERLYVYEPYTDQCFYTTRETIAWTMLKANEKLAKTFDVRLNYIIELLGGEKRPEADLIGWNWENEAQDYCWSYYGGPWIEMVPQVMTMKNGKTAFAMFYQVDPDTQNPSDMIYKEYGGT